MKMVQSTVDHMCRISSKEIASSENSHEKEEKTKNHLKKSQVTIREDIPSYMRPVS